MGIFFGFQSLCAESGEKFLHKKMENSHPHCRKVQKTLLHSRKLSKVISTAETREMFILRQKQKISSVCSVVPQTLDSMFVHKLVVVECDLGAHSVGASDSTSFLEKTQTKHCLITSRHMSKVQEVQKHPQQIAREKQCGVCSKVCVMY